MAKRPLDTAEQIDIASEAALRDWLSENHSRDTGVWLVTHKKAVPDLYVSTGQIIRQCLCFGWIDSLVRGKDDIRTMNYIAPRNPKSNWSRVNKDIVAELESQGLIAPPGAKLIADAKKSGTWTALDDVENGVIPADLQTAFDAAKGVEDQWHALPRSVRRGALEILLNAKRDDTRARKIAQIINETKAGRRPFQ